MEGGLVPNDGIAVVSDQDPPRRGDRRARRAPVQRRPPRRSCFGLGLAPSARSDPAWRPGRLHTLYRAGLRGGQPQPHQRGPLARSRLRLRRGSGALATARRQPTGGFRPQRSDADRRHVAQPGAAAAHARIRVHSGATLTAADVTVHDGIPCTTVARTLLDLADVLSFDALDRAVHEACLRCACSTWQAVNAVLVERERAPGSSRSCATSSPTPAISRDRCRTPAIEERFFAFCRAQGLPRPEVHQPRSRPPPRRSRSTSSGASSDSSSRPTAATGTPRSASACATPTATGCSRTPATACAAAPGRRWSTSPSGWPRRLRGLLCSLASLRCPPPEPTSASA